MAVTTIKYGRATSIGGSGNQAGAPGTNYSGEPNGEFKSTNDGSTCNPVPSEVLNDKTLTDEKIKSITNWSMGSIANIKVSRYFTFKHMFGNSQQASKGIEHTNPSAKIQATQQQVAMNIRQVAVQCAGPIIASGVPMSSFYITNSFRNYQPKVKQGDTVAKAGTSQHNWGAACDMQWEHRNKLLQLAHRAQQVVPQFGQLILEHQNGCVHISTRVGTSRKNQVFSTGKGAKIGTPCNPSSGKNGYSKNMGSSSGLLASDDGRVLKTVR